MVASVFIMPAFGLVTVSSTQELVRVRALHVGASKIASFMNIWIFSIINELGMIFLIWLFAKNVGQIQVHVNWMS